MNTFEMNDQQPSPGKISHQRGGEVERGCVDSL
jgi:hypothetical protein